MLDPYQRLLELLRGLVASPEVETLLQRALEGALELIPGVEAGSALVREGEAYRFVALQCHRIAPPQYRLSLDDELRWYGGSLEEALAGLPRANPVQPELSGLAPGDKIVLGEFRWVLALPVPLEGRVEAWLCLDRSAAEPPPDEALRLAQELALSLSVVLQTLRERERTQARLRREEGLARVLGTLSTFQEAEALWQALPGLALEILGEPRAAVLRREGDELVIVAGANWREPFRRRIPEGVEMSWKAVRERTVCMAHLDDPVVFNFSRFEHEPEEYGVYVPLFDAANEVLGVLNVYSVHPFSPQDRSLLEALGRGVGQVLGRLEAQAAQARDLARLQALARAGQSLTPAHSTEEVFQLAVKEALAQTGASTALLSLYDPQAEVMEVVAAAGYLAEGLVGTRRARGAGLAWEVLAGRSALYLPDASRSPQAVYLSGSRTKAAYLGVPLSDPEGRVVGVLSVDTAGAGGEIAPQDRYSLEALAKVAGVAISRLWALEHAYQQADHYRALVGMSADLEVLSDPLEIARRALETLLPLTGFNAGALYALQEERETLLCAEQVFAVGYGAAQERPFQIVPIHTDHSLGAALLRGETVRIEDYGLWEFSSPELRVSGLRSLVCTPLWKGKRVYGLLALGSFSDPQPINKENVALFEATARRVERALERAAHLEEITQTREAALRALGLGLELRDIETKGHTDRVVALSIALGERLGFADLEGLRLGAYLHDLGKLAIPDAILFKPDKLDAAEWHLMKSHCDIGFGMIENLTFLPPSALNVVRYHHERLNGSGYPQGLKGESIPLEARIFAVVDVYDTLTQARPYKRAWSQTEALAELARQAGGTLDAQVVGALFALLEDSLEEEIFHLEER